MPRITEEMVKVAFRLPPEKAVRYLEQKGFTFGWDWKDTWQEAHARAFTVAKVARMDVLVAIRQMVDRSVREGITFDRFQKSLEPYLKLAGWWGRTWAIDENGELLGDDGKPFPTDENGTPIIPDDAVPPMLGSTHRLRTIYQTNMQVAFNTGRYQGQQATTNTRPFWQYISVVDNRTTQLCGSMHLAVYRHDDPIWSLFYPPNHWKCRARVRSVSPDQIERYGYDVSSSEGKIGEQDVVISAKTGETAKAATLTIGEHTYRADPAWSYNPAAVPFTPDVTAYPKELQKAFAKEKR